MKIDLINGGYTLINDEDNKIIESLKWYRHKNGYAVSQQRRDKMHRLIMNCPKGMEVDHINGDRLDNRKENLRICTHKQNIWNMKKQPEKSSIYKGVCRVKKNNCWVAYIHYNAKNSNLGYFKNELHAAMVYDIWAKELFGEYANLNFK